MQRVPVSYYDVLEHRYRYNSKNLHAYDPYRYETDETGDGGVMVVDGAWWQAQAPSVRALVEQRLAVMQPPVALRRGTVAVPHAEQYHASLVTVYRAYLDAYDYHVWYSPTLRNGPRNVTMLLLSDAEKRVLARRFGHCGAAADESPPSGGGGGSDDDEDSQGAQQTVASHWSALRERLRGVLDAEQQYFVRLSSTSGKNVCELRPVPGNDVDGLLGYLCANPQFVSCEFERTDKTTYLVLMPWQTAIDDDRCEFRIFVRGRRITAASQQAWYEMFNYSDEELDAVQRALETDVPFLDDVPYDEWVGDVWIDMAAAKCHLIECNPFGAHSGSGSALFEWHRDIDVLQGDTPPQLRYQSLVL